MWFQMNREFTTVKHKFPIMHLDFTTVLRCSSLHQEVERLVSIRTHFLWHRVAPSRPCGS